MKNIPAKSKKKVTKSSKFWFLAAITYIVFFWSIIVHPFEFPDEQAHMGSIEFLRREGRMPVGVEKDMTEEMKLSQEYLGVYRNLQGQNKYTYHPEYHVDYTDNLIGKYEPDIIALNKQIYQDEYVATEAARYPVLYYAYENMVTKPAHASDLFTRLFSLRLAGVFLAFMMAYYVYRLGFLIFGKAVYARTLTMMVMLMPMMSFVNAGVNSDNLHNLLFTLIIYSALKLILKGFAISTLITLTCATTLDLYTKPQGAIALPIIVLAILITLFKYKNWKLFIGLVVGVLLVIILGRSNLTPYLSLISVANPHNSSFAEFVRFSLNKLVTQNIVWFWGVYKWLGVVLPPIYWQVANRVVLISLLGFAIYLYKAIKGKKIIVFPLTSIFLVLTTTIYSLSIYWFDWTYTKNVGFGIGVQARYFYPVIAPIMALMLTGLLSLVSKLKHRRIVRYLVISLFIWLQLGGLYTLVKSYYDLSSFELAIRQMSQYKPWWGKGNIWYIWIPLYFGSLIYLTYRSFVARKTK